MPQMLEPAKLSNKQLSRLLAKEMPEQGRPLFSPMFSGEYDKDYENTQIQKDKFNRRSHN
jgi:hypothetical protein